MSGVFGLRGAEDAAYLSYISAGTDTAQDGWADGRGATRSDAGVDI